MENLEALLTKIRHDGVEAAQAEAAKIVANAKKEAADTAARAKAEAEALVQQAKLEAARSAQGAEAAIRQAARDVLLKLEQDVSALFKRTLGGTIDASLAAGPLVEKLVADAVTAYIKNGPVEVVAAPKLAQALKTALVKQKDVTVLTDPLTGAGFHIRLDGGRVEHDFTSASVTDALTELLRPQLAELLKE